MSPLGPGYKLRVLVHVWVRPWPPDLSCPERGTRIWRTMFQVRVSSAGVDSIAGGPGRKGSMVGGIRNPSRWAEHRGQGRTPGARVRCEVRVRGEVRTYNERDRAKCMESRYRHFPALGRAEHGGVESGLLVGGARSPGGCGLDRRGGVRVPVDGQGWVDGDRRPMGGALSKGWGQGSSGFGPGVRWEGPGLKWENQGTGGQGQWPSRVRAQVGGVRA